MKEFDRLAALAFADPDRTVVDLKFFVKPGHQSPEAICKDAHSIMMQIKSGQAIGSDRFEEGFEQVDMREFLAGLPA